MLEENKFIIQSDTGEQIECEVLFTYEDEKSGKCYIAYTDNTEDEDGNTKVYASIFDPEAENPVLLPIENEEEWQMIDNILANLQEDDEEE